MKLPLKCDSSELVAEAKKSLSWLIVNFIGLIGVFIVFRNIHPMKVEVFGGGQAWMMTTGENFMGGALTLLILIPMFFVNLVWLFLIAWERNRPKLLLWLLVGIVWIILYIFNGVLNRFLYPGSWVN